MIVFWDDSVEMNFQNWNILMIRIIIHVITYNYV